MSIELIGTIKPKNNGDFAIAEDIDLKGGCRSVADAAALAAITTERRSEGMLVYQIDTGKFYQLANDLITWNEAQMGGGAGFIWTAAKTWSQVYAEIVAAGGIGTLYVPNDGAKEMTPDLSGFTNLDGVLFVGIRNSDGNLPIVDIDSVGIGGFLLGGNRCLHSKDINWQTYYKIVDGPGVNCTWEFDGGGITSVTTEAAYRSVSVTIILRNATIDGTSCASGLFIGLRNGATVLAFDGSVIGDKSFYGFVGVPPYPSITVYTDSGTSISPTAYVGTGINFVVSRVDQASLVSYDDSALPSWGVSNVQAFLDAVKNTVSPPSHMRIDFWNGGEAWDDVYDRMSSSGGGILFVWWDGGTPRMMTPNPAGSTDLSRVFFVGLRQTNGSLPQIQVDPANLGTFVLSASGVLHSKDIEWQMPAYQLVDATIYAETAIEIDGGSLTTVAASAGVWKAKTARLSLRNGALFDGSNCGVGSALIETTDAVNPSNTWVETLANLGASAFTSAVAHPVNLNWDSSSVIDNNAFIGGTIVVNSLPMADLLAAGTVVAGSTSADVSAILQADSTTQGFLPPRMTNAERTAIGTPAIGLMVYCTDVTEGLYVYKSGGWQFIA